MSVSLFVDYESLLVVPDLVIHTSDDGVKILKKDEEANLAVKLKSVVNGYGVELDNINASLVSTLYKLAVWGIAFHLYGGAV